MRVIEVVGPSCADCLRLELVAAEAVRASGIEAEVRKVTDEGGIRRYGIVDPPGLVIDGVVASEGVVPSVAEISAWLTGANRIPAAV